MAQLKRGAGYIRGCAIGLVLLVAVMPKEKAVPSMLSSLSLSKDDGARQMPVAKWEGGVRLFQPSNVT